jgi:hypothetical protein
MGGSQFGSLLRSRAGSQRALLAGSLAIVADWLGLAAADARTRRDRMHKPRRPATMAPSAGTCNQGTPGFCSAANPAHALCDDSLSCVRLQTTGGSAFCGSLAARARGCADCEGDADCLALGLPSGSACVPFATGACAGACESGMACVAPCDVAPGDAR